jgi:hypothetical protein
MRVILLVNLQEKLLSIYRENLQTSLFFVFPKIKVSFDIHLGQFNQASEKCF